MFKNFVKLDNDSSETMYVHNLSPNQYSFVLQLEQRFPRFLHKTRDEFNFQLPAIFAFLVFRKEWSY
jgi:hypothetical protein